MKPSTTPKPHLNEDGPTHLIMDKLRTGARDRIRGRRRRACAVSVLVAGLLTGVVGCSQGQPTANEADSAYSTAVVEHHAQTLQILDLSLGRPGVTDQMGTLADATRKQMFTEARAASRRLRTWHRPVPTTALEHRDMNTRQHYDTTVPGVLSAAQMTELMRTHHGFLAAWLDDLVAHERGAITLAKQELAAGQDPTTLTIAREDLRSHQERLAKLVALQPD